MSDFLGRLTARHTESTLPTVMPRAVSRFEASPVPVQHDTVESAAPAGGETVAARSPAPPWPLVEPRTAAEAQLPSAQRARHDAEPLRPIERAEPIRNRVEQIIKEVKTIVASRTIAEPRRETVRDQHIVASPVVPRIDKNSEPHPIALGRAAARQIHAAESAPTVIRVHIGRVEVRANPVQTERPRVRSAKRSDLPQPMSLDRYLSGKDRP